MMQGDPRSGEHSSKSAIGFASSPSIEDPLVPP
jgi:hypothetical protein